MEAAPRTQRLSRVWFLTAGMVVILLVTLPWILQWPVVDSGLEISWPVVAVLYGLGEAAVLHFRFRRDAHSFSMGEIALAISLLVASPLNHILGQMVGNTVALVWNRRQTPVKAAFNLAQFALQTVAAVSVFRLVLQDDDPLSVRGWLAVVLGALSALAVSDTAVNAAIRLSGGAASAIERWTVRAFSSLGAVINAAFGILAVLVWTLGAAALVLALMPPVMLFLAYRAYTDQRADRSRVVSLQGAAEALLAAETPSDVVRLAAAQTQAIFEVERAVAALYAHGGIPSLYCEWLADGSSTLEEREVRLSMDESSAATLNVGQLASMGERFEGSHQGLYAPIGPPSRPVGYLLAIDPLSDVVTFGEVDAQLINAYAGQVGTVVENERLGGAVSALSELVESKNEVLAAVGHELRSPLAAVVSAAATLEARSDRLTEDQQRELLRLIHRNGLELSAVADDLMVAARNEEGPEPELQRIDPLHEIRSVLAGLASAAEEVEVRGDPQPVMADANRFRQIVRNLLVNAERYGGDKVWIEFEASPRWLELAVADDGLGVPDEQADLIFEPYATAHSHADRPQALGLGLAISRRLARSMGGDVRYERRDGATQFILRLRRADQESG